jgi:2-hydroxychromene-2-carboxylate isomerase
MTVEFHFDFGSPNAYLAHRVIPAIEQRTGRSFAYVPILLGGVFKLTGNVAPMVAFKDIPSKLAYQRHEMRRFIARHGLAAFRMNPHFPVNTVQIMRGAVAAQIDGVAERYVECVFRAMWEDGRKMDDAAIIKGVLDQAGLDGARLLQRMTDQDVKDALIANTDASVKRGTFGAPMVFVGSEMFFGKDSLRDVEDEITRSAAG